MEIESLFLIKAFVAYVANMGKFTSMAADMVE